MEINMKKDVSLKVSKHLEEIDSMFKDALKNQILPDRSYTQITTKIGHIDSTYMNDHFKQSDEAYYHWVKGRLDKICELLVSLQKHSSSSFSIHHEDLMNVTGDYYNEDNTISLTNEIKNSINTIINDTYSIHD
jgi:hypothetical protein